MALPLGIEGTTTRTTRHPGLPPSVIQKLVDNKFMVWEVVWLSRPGLPRNPTKHNCQVLYQKKIANNNAGN